MDTTEMASPDGAEGERRDGDELGPEERRKAAAQILARGIRRLLTRVTAVPVADSWVSATSVAASQLTENTEKGALPVVPNRALMRTKAG